MSDTKNAAVINMLEMFSECVTHLRSEIKTMHDPKCMAMFETAAEVLEGLSKAFQDYREKKEPAWQ